MRKRGRPPKVKPGAEVVQQATDDDAALLDESFFEVPEPKPRVKEKLPPPPKAKVTPGSVHVSVIPDYEDDDSKLYPSPKSDPVYKAKWNMFVGNVVGRQNFKPGHLEQLNLLCDLYVEYEDLKAFTRANGYTYFVAGKNGQQIKPYPEYIALSRVLSEIRNYSKVLGLLLVKDTKMKDPEKKDTWD